MLYADCTYIYLERVIFPKYNKYIHICSMQTTTCKHPSCKSIGPLSPTFRNERRMDAPCHHLTMVKNIRVPHVSFETNPMAWGKNGLQKSLWTTINQYKSVTWTEQKSWRKFTWKTPQHQLWISDPHTATTTSGLQGIWLGIFSRCVKRAATSPVCYPTLLEVVSFKVDKWHMPTFIVTLLHLLLHWPLILW